MEPLLKNCSIYLYNNFLSILHLFFTEIVQWALEANHRMEDLPYTITDQMKTAVVDVSTEFHMLL